MVIKKSVLVLLAALVGLTWVQAFPEHRDEFYQQRQLSDAIVQDDNDIESLRVTASRTSGAYGSNNIAILPPIKNGLSKATPTHSRQKFKLNLKTSLQLIRDIYAANDEAKDKWGSLSPLDRSYLLNMRQTLCNVVLGVDMPLDVQDIQDVQNVICSPLFPNNEEEMSL
ncbi:unnamed protein product [Euphydryas editha]|uniref:Uncharacterized protein n=1 Tax=Euphydryas editha TaxID=104508 RepID=A0AAU9TWT5_EUPED|nr:unnamed protein product [Euphydryas editha]